MIELYLSKVTENSESEQAGKYYARVSYKQNGGTTGGGDNGGNSGGDNGGGGNLGQN